MKDISVAFWLMTSVLGTTATLNAGRTKNFQIGDAIYDLKYEGCYSQDDWASGSSIGSKDADTVEECAEACSSQSRPYAVVRNVATDPCRCRSTLPPSSRRIVADYCERTCGVQRLKCGSSYYRWTRASVYDVRELMRAYASHL
ncbi:PREDICTED: uncharacterized protein LOC106806527 [Priapulus caudatus]|uniref:Uncharacterized protein LOC106806527 n=1 Tax=Priapulus caudatus TaxID=37621 RepID=A0ABM1DVL4_PRICU|nr:PREDICTED: uncharacterized protein LOC106806527 [Priapulus caudatus]